MLLYTNYDPVDGNFNANKSGGSIANCQISAVGLK